jgi:hypothetical protein
MNIKIKNHKVPWGKIREGIFWVVFWILLSLAAFEAGYILRDWQKDDTREIALKNDAKIKDIHGRMTVLEGPPPKKAESRRQ